MLGVGHQLCPQVRVGWLWCWGTEGSSQGTEGPAEEVLAAHASGF